MVQRCEGKEIRKEIKENRRKYSNYLLFFGYVPNASLPHEISAIMANN